MRTLFLSILFLFSTTLSFAQFIPPTRLYDEGSLLGPIYTIDCVGDNIACTRAGTTGTFTISGGAGSQSLWETIVSDLNSTTANSANDILTVLGETGIVTRVSGDTMYVGVLTIPSANITEDDPQVGTLTNTKWCSTDGSAVNCTEEPPGGSQNIWATFQSDMGLSTTANTTTDTLTVNGETGLVARISGDTLYLGVIEIADAQIPDTITASNYLATAGTDIIKDTHVDWGSGANQVDLADIPGGTAGANAFDFGGATSLEVPNTAGDVTADAAGEIAVDSTQKQLVWFDGTRENAIPSDKKLVAIITAADWDLDSDKWLWEFDSTIYPDGIVITKWTVDANVADPDVELNANLMYCDALASGAFPGDNATLIDVLDTTTGNSSESTMGDSDLGSGTIPAGKIMYVDIDVDPATATDFFVLQIYFYQPES